MFNRNVRALSLSLLYSHAHTHHMKLEMNFYLERGTKNKGRKDDAR